MKKSEVACHHGRNLPLKRCWGGIRGYTSSVLAVNDADYVIVTHILSYETESAAAGFAFRQYPTPGAAGPGITTLPGSNGFLTP